MGILGDSVNGGLPTGKERWQTLYELGMKKREDMEIIRKNYQDLKEQEEKSCTFKPQIYSKNTSYDPSTRISGDSFSRMSVVDRTKIWAENKQKKIEMLKD